MFTRDEWKNVLCEVLIKLKLVAGDEKE